MNQPQPNAIIEHKPSAFDLMLSPSTLQDLDKLCETLANSGMVPTIYAGKPKMIAVAATMGHRLGVDIFSALAGIAVINGRPAVWGDLMLAVCQKDPSWEDMEERFDEKTHTAVCTVSRKGRKPYVSTFSFDDAKVAGLLGKQGPWTTNPKRMCGMRARAFALRGVYADILAGFVTREEMEDADLLEVQGTVVPDAKPAKVREVKEKPGARIPDIRLDPEVVKEARERNKEIDARPEKPADVKEADPVVITDLDTKPTVADLVAMVTNVAKEFGPEGIEAIRAINAHLGIKKTGECPADRVEEAVKMLVDATGKLADAQGRDGGRRE